MIWWIWWKKIFFLSNVIRNYEKAYFPYREGKWKKNGKLRNGIRSPRLKIQNLFLPYRIGLRHLRQTRYSTNLRHKHVPYDALVYFLRIPMFYKFSSLQHNSNHFKSILNQTKNDYIQESKCRSSSLCFALSVSVLLSL